MAAVILSRHKPYIVLKTKEVTEWNRNKSYNVNYGVTEVQQLSPRGLLEWKQQDSHLVKELTVHKKRIFKHKKNLCSSPRICVKFRGATKQS